MYLSVDFVFLYPQNNNFLYLWFCFRRSAEVVGTRRSISIRCRSCSFGYHVRAKSHLHLQSRSFSGIYRVLKQNLPFHCGSAQACMCLHFICFLVPLESVQLCVKKLHLQNMVNFHFWRICNYWF